MFLVYTCILCYEILCPNARIQRAGLAIWQFADGLSGSAKKSPKSSVSQHCSYTHVTAYRHVTAHSPTRID